MDTHKNAPLTPKGREAMVPIVIEGGMTKAGRPDGSRRDTSRSHRRTATKHLH
jgi:hypothetical protein